MALIDTHTDTVTAIRPDMTRTMRHTPLATLARHPTDLVQTLLAFPEMHARLRPTWSRQDPSLTSQVFAWVEQARLHNSRTDHQEHGTGNWMRDAELAA